MTRTRSSCSRRLSLSRFRRRCCAFRVSPHHFRNSLLCLIVMALFSTALAMPLARLALARAADERRSVGGPVAPARSSQILRCAGPSVAKVGTQRLPHIASLGCAERLVAHHPPSSYRTVILDR